jgi:hypothetical protein
MNVRPEWSWKHRARAGVVAATCIVAVFCAWVELNTPSGRVWDGGDLGSKGSVLEHPGLADKTYDVHVVWVARHLGEQTAPLPDAIRGWRRPFATLQVWDKDRVEREFPEHVDMLRQIGTPAWISDILRYLIMHRYGGIYLDTDVLAVNSDLRWLLTLTPSFTVCEEYSLWSSHTCTRMCNGVIASTQQHPALECAVNTTLTRTREALRSAVPAFSLDISGPPMWSQCCFEHGMPVLPEHSFFPCSYQQKPCNDRAKYAAQGVYGMHMWTHSWKADAP